MGFHSAGIIDPGYSFKHRIERVLRKDVFDVGNEKFLVLLFVMQAEDQNWLDFGEQGFVRFFE